MYILKFISIAKPCDIRMIHKIFRITTPNKEETTYLKQSDREGVFHFQLFSMLSARTCGAV